MKQYWDSNNHRKYDLDIITDIPKITLSISIHSITICPNYPLVI